MTQQHKEPITRNSLGVFQRFLEAMADAISKTGLHPNAITVLSLVPAIFAGWAAAEGLFVLAAVLFLASGFLDLLDGAMARQSGRETRFGALLDSTCDRLADAAIPTGLVVYYAPHNGVVVIPVLAIVSGFIISYVRARAEGLNMELPRLWMRRQDRLGLMVLALLLAPVPLTGMNVPAPVTLIIVAILTVLGFAAAVTALMHAAKSD